jgi:putative membrane protein
MKKFWGAFTLLASGLLGYFVLNAEHISEPLFPMLSGLFGTSVLITAIAGKVNIPQQRTTEMIAVPAMQKWKAIVGSAFSGSLVGMLPGVGSATAALISMYVLGGLGAYSFLILTGGINTSNFVFSLATFYSLNKARNGAIVAVQQLIESISLHDLIILGAVVLIVGGIATMLTLWLAKKFSKWMQRVNYSLTCKIILSFIVLLTIFLSGPIGLLILITSTALGMVPGFVGVKRSNCMACILVPVMIFFFLI